MVNDEIYILTKHARFNAEYIENIPVYRRRYYLYLLEKEIEEIEKLKEKEMKKIKKKPR